MADRAITRFIDVAVTKATPSVSEAGFNIPLVITDSSLVTTTTRFKRFTSDTSVSTYFGASSEEYLAANAFFNQSNQLTYQPEEMQFGRYADAATSAVIECGDSCETDYEVWKLIDDGEFLVTIDGSDKTVVDLDFTAVTSLDDVASVISSGISGGSCYYQVNRFVIDSDTTGATSLITLLSTVAAPSGTDISVAAYLDGDTAVSPAYPGGAILSQGQVAETPEAAITAIETVTTDWAALGLLKKYRDTDDAESFAASIESRIKTMFLATNDANVLTLGSTSTMNYALKQLNYKRTSLWYHDNSALYPDMSIMGQQLPKDLGSTNYAYKEMAGTADYADVEITSVDLTQDQIDAALDVNCNVYTTTLGSTYTYFGIMVGGKNADKEGEKINIVRDIDFLQIRIEEQMLSLFLENDIINLTDGGISMAEARLWSALDTYGVQQNILSEGSVTTYFPKRSDISTSDRDDQLLPDGKFSGELSGSIDKVIIRGTVYV